MSCAGLVWVESCKGRYGRSWVWDRFVPPAVEVDVMALFHRAPRAGLEANEKLVKRVG